jgi:hypothetical protein
MSMAQFNVATTFIFSQAYQGHPTPLHLEPAFFLMSLQELDLNNADDWHGGFIHTAQWLQRENYITIGSIDMGGTIHQLGLTEKGLRLLTSPSSLEKLESPDWGEALVVTTQGNDFKGWQEIGKALLQEGSKLGLRALLSQFTTSV